MLLLYYSKLYGKIRVPYGRPIGFPGRAKATILHQKKVLSPLRFLKCDKKTKTKSPQVVVKKIIFVKILSSDP